MKGGGKGGHFIIGEEVPNNVLSLSLNCLVFPLSLHTSSQNTTVSRLLLTLTLGDGDTQHAGETDLTRGCHNWRTSPR